VRPPLGPPLQCIYRYYLIQPSIISGSSGVDTLWVRIRVMVFNDTFNNISVISWRSVLLVEETRVPGEKDRPDASH
jgi:hypothetical protein